MTDKSDLLASLKEKRAKPGYKYLTVDYPAPFGPLGLITYLRTYARRHDDDDPNSTVENWDECLRRVVLACNSQLGVGFTKDEEDEIFHLMYSLKCSVAGRFLWQLGTRTVERTGLMSLQNCCFERVNSPVDPFVWGMNFLMLGSGLGYSIMPEDIDQFPPVKHAVIVRNDVKDADFIVPDSREGWIKLLGKVLKAHFYSGKGFSYSCMLLRSKGAPIKSFGGVASGPDVLCVGMERISEVLNKRVGEKLRPIDALDVMNLIGQVVVSGNVRRSAQIALGDINDEEYMRAKRWDLGNVPNHRAYSNNSVICNDIEDALGSEEFWQGYNGNGEPYGLINLDLSRSCGRLGETEFPDPDVEGFNPCFSADTLIGIADGRDSISIKQLFEEGRDVPVYSYNQITGEVEIKWGRNPRITGKDKKLIRIHFGHQHKNQYIDVTENHKFITTNGDIIEAKDLKKSDSLPMFRKAKFDDSYIRVFKNTSGTRQTEVEHRMIKKFYESQQFDDLYIEGVRHGCCQTNGVVIHHKDENRTNNHPENLEVTTASKHSTHHGKELTGKRNPMYGNKHSKETKRKIGQKTKERCQDQDYLLKLSQSHTEEEREKSSVRMKKLKEGWDTERYNQIEEECKKTNLRYKRLGPKNIVIFRICEYCQLEFGTSWWKRGQPYCSNECSNRGETAINNRREGIRKTRADQSKQIFNKQVAIYKDLQEFYDPVMKRQWEEACKEQKVSFRFQTNTPNPWICRNWREFKGRADDHNHRVSHIEELPGLHTVYNITVEDNHTVAIVTKANYQQKNFQGIYTLQCAEQSLCNKESCCLAELFLPNISSKRELFACATYLYRICKHSLRLPCPESKETEDIVHKNMRMGIGVTGYLQATDEQRGWLSECYGFLRGYDKSYSSTHGFPPSIKISTTKPSGTLSLLAGVTSGVHPGYAQYYIRRIRIASESSLINLVRKHGYPVEYVKNFDGTNDLTTMVISFPYKLPEGTTLAKDCTAIEQMEWVKKLQTEWSDNSVSVTVYYRKEELPEIKEWLRKNYNTSVKTISFLLFSGHGFVQAPMEEITKEQYEEMTRTCRPITSVEGVCYHAADEKFIGENECTGSACPTR